MIAALILAAATAPAMTNYSIRLYDKNRETVVACAYNDYGPVPGQLARFIINGLSRPFTANDKAQSQEIAGFTGTNAQWNFYDAKEDREVIVTKTNWVRVAVQFGRDNDHAVRTNGPGCN